MVEAAQVNSISLRAVTTEDASFLLVLYKSSRGDDLRGLGWEEERVSEFLDMQYEAQQRFHANEYRRPVDQIVVRNGEAIGRIMFEPREHEIRCVDIALQPKHRSAGIGAYLRTRSHAAHQKQEKLAVVQLPTPPAPEPAPVEVKVQGVQEVGPVDEFIVISVDTDPDGVKVKVDGEPRGATPIDVRVKRGETPLKVELAQTGFDTHQLDVIPDRDQRLYFALMKQQKKIVPVRTPPKSERKPGFRRFD